jgi:hypothetical protein
MSDSVKDFGQRVRVSEGYAEKCRREGIKGETRVTGEVGTVVGYDASCRFVEVEMDNDPCNFGPGYKYLFYTDELEVVRNA